MISETFLIKTVLWQGCGEVSGTRINNWSALMDHQHNKLRDHALACYLNNSNGLSPRLLTDLHLMALEFQQASEPSSKHGWVLWCTSTLPKFSLLQIFTKVDRVCSDPEISPRSEVQIVNDILQYWQVTETSTLVFWWQWYPLIVFCSHIERVTEKNLLDSLFLFPREQKLIFLVSAFCFCFCFSERDLNASFVFTALHLTRKISCTTSEFYCKV
jgi:hypothetical protein